MEEWIRSLSVGDEITLRVGDYVFKAPFAEFSTDDIDEVDMVVTGVKGEREFVGKEGTDGYAVRVEFNDLDVAREMGAEREGGRLVWDGSREEYDLTLVVAGEVTAVSQTPAHVDVWPVSEDDRNGLSESVGEYRQPAIDAIEKMRAKSVMRVVLMDAYVRYAAETGQSDVWRKYAEDAEEPSLTGFLGWLTQEQIGDLIEEAGMMFPEYAGEDELLDVSPRSGWDVVFALKHFRS